MISIDRYLAISRPLHYGIQGRTKRKMAWYIACVWCVAILISIPPLFFFGGNEYIANEKCGYSPSIAYQLYATLGAFYIPLLTTLIVYGQVYRLASRVARAERRSLGTVVVTPSNLPTSSSLNVPSHNNGVQAASAKLTQNSTGRFWFLNRSSTNPAPTAAHNKKRFNSQSSTSTHSPQSISPTESHASSSNVVMRSTVLTPEIPATSNGFTKHRHFTSITQKTIVSSHPPPLLRINRNNSSNPGAGGTTKFIKRERKAMRTLSAITAAFVMCWLPFFILALLAPICSACKIPAWLSATTLWLGYCNSFINPFLYAYFNRDFRTPFRAIMCCQCHRLHDELRVEQFRAQYGSTAGGASTTMGGASAAVVADRSASLHRSVANDSRHNSSSVKIHHHRGSRETIQTASGSRNGSFRHQRYVERGGSGGPTPAVRAQSIELSSLSTGNERTDEHRYASPVSQIMQPVMQDQGVLLPTPLNVAAPNGSVMLVDEKPSSTGLEAHDVSHDSDDEHKRKRSKRKHRRHLSATSEIATNTDITGAMIESYVAKKRYLDQNHQQQNVVTSNGGYDSLLMHNHRVDEMPHQSETSGFAKRESSQWTTASGRVEETL